MEASDQKEGPEKKKKKKDQNDVEVTVQQWSPPPQLRWAHMYGNVLGHCDRPPRWPQQLHPPAPSVSQ